MVRRVPACFWRDFPRHLHPLVPHHRYGYPPALLVYSRQCFVLRMESAHLGVARDSHTPLWCIPGNRGAPHEPVVLARFRRRCLGGIAPASIGVFVGYITGGVFEQTVSRSSRTPSEYSARLDRKALGASLITLCLYITAVCTVPRLCFRCLRGVIWHSHEFHAFDDARYSWFLFERLTLIASRAYMQCKQSHP